MVTKKRVSSDWKNRVRLANERYAKDKIRFEYDRKDGAVVLYKDLRLPITLSGNGWIMLTQRNRVALRKLGRAGMRFSIP